MTLQEAINSGRNFARRDDASEGTYYTAAEFLEGGITLEEFNAVDYELEPVIVASIPRNILEEAWNDAKGTRTSIDIASRSKLFTDLVTQLERRNVTVTS